ncbi:MAG: DUF4865 family protein [Steroidobacteraceae bacterium]|jgi:hypothetical protein
MRSTHYPIELAATFDMAQIEERVRLRGHAFEHLDGLAMKAFLVQSVAKGATRNRYAPLYVWDSDRAISEFLIGPLFGGVIESFGRPNVIDRRVLVFAVTDRSVHPTLATFETAVSDPAARPAELWEFEARRHREILQTPGLLMACTLLDTQGWNITRVQLWANEDSAQAAGVGPDAERFEVLRAVGPALNH